MKTPRSLTSVIVLTAVATTCAGCSSRTESATARVDRLFAEWNKSDSPGCGVGISRNGRLVYEHGYGMANLDLGVPITRDSVFPVASVSKQFTAMSVVLLAQRGQLSLDDEVRKYIPELPDYGRLLTIRHLLTHTSGLRDGFALLGWAAPSDGRVDPNEAALTMLTRQRGLNFTPGAEYQYNNGAYNLLGSLVKRVSGQSLRAFADANIFKPLSMTHSHFHDDPTMIVPNRASGYSRAVNGWHRASEASGVVGNAGLHSTIGDLLRWQQNFADVRVGTPALVAAMQTPTVLTSGQTSQYGFGLAIGQYRGVRTIEHAGADSGISSNVVRYPEQGLALAVLCNLDNVDVGAIANGVADVYLADVLKQAPANDSTAPTPHMTLSAGELASKTGLYLNASSERLVRVSVRNGALVVRSFYTDDMDVELTPVNANRFVIPGATLEFAAATGGRPQECHLLNTEGKQIAEFQLNTFVPSPVDLQSSAGDYRSAELDVSYTVTTGDGSLVVLSAGRGEIALYPVFKDVFAGDSVGTVRFTRDARGTVTGFTVNRANARGVRFDRITRARA
jgi:CubicO group peptidase (beta-lactamase class C family)